MFLYACTEKTFMIWSAPPLRFITRPSSKLCNIHFAIIHPMAFTIFFLHVCLLKINFAVDTLAW